jgi:dCMP deaminase
MTRDEYYMTIAMAVRKKANCLGRRVGAVIVRDNRIVATGYNGTPEGVANCQDGGCARCRDKEAYAPSVGYDVCVCVHAEQNALITTARFGNAIEDATVYSTMRPCFDCTKSMLQAKIQAIYYVHNWEPKIESLQQQYAIVQDKFRWGVRPLNMEDPEGDWANNVAITAPVNVKAPTNGHPRPV